MMKFNKEFLSFASKFSVLPFNIGFSKLFYSTTNSVINYEDTVDVIDYGQFEINKMPHKKRTISKLQELFNCSHDHATDIVKHHPILVKRSIENINKAVSFLEEKSVKQNILYDNPWILGIKNDELKEKIELIEMIEYKKIDHFVPFLQLETKDLQHVVKIMQCEVSTVPGKNRLYYFKNMTKVETMVISQHFAQRWFIYEVNYLYFKNILTFLLDSGVTPYNILRDLWVFKYHPAKIRERITIAKRANSKKIMPWMVRCKEGVFQRFLSRTKETNDVLANRSLEDYLGEKLKCDMDMVKYIINNNPTIKKIHITKVQDTLDYLLGQGFSAYHIAQAPKILSHSLQTTKERLEEIKALGLSTNSLVILCKSKKEYAKHLKALAKCSIRESLRNK